MIWTLMPLLAACARHEFTFDDAGADGGNSGTNVDAGFVLGSPDAGSIFGSNKAPLDACSLPIPLTNAPATTTLTTCSESELRSAIALGGTVAFACVGSIVVSSEILIGTDVVIEGANNTLDGRNANRIFHVAPGVHVVIQSLGFFGGLASDGGAIYDEGASLVVIASGFRGNHATTSGAAIASVNTGSITVESSTFEYNDSANGGAVSIHDKNLTLVNSAFTWNDAGLGGALTVVGAAASATLCGDDFSFNQASTRGGAVDLEGVIGGASQLVIDRTTFHENGIDLYTGMGAGVYVTNATVTASSSTFTENIANAGGAMVIDGSTQARLSNLTVASNESTKGGGVLLVPPTNASFFNCTIALNIGGGISGAGAEIENSILVNNTHDEFYGTTDCGFASTGTSPSIEFPSGPFACTPGTFVANPMLDGYQDNGGSVFTMRPLSGSPAIGAGVSCTPTDAVGKVRPSACTLGALEP